MRIGVPREAGRLVAATPTTVGRLTGLGYEVLVEAGAGEAASFPDAAYLAAGAAIGSAADAWGADVVTAVEWRPRAPAGLLRPGATLVAQLAPATRADLLHDLAEHAVTALALDAVPRISRAQSLDVLSALSNVAGYRAVVEAAAEYGGMLAGQVTAAGTTRPATVFVVGAGVAGLAAIGAAASLGAQVRAFDVRPEAAEQIESTGGTVVRASGATQTVSADGYASTLSEDQEAAAARVYATETAAADIVVTTALVRGTAPRTITAEMVAAMRPGSVIVDLAAPGGGNCELTVPGERVVTPNGVVILGYTDLAARLPRHSSELVGTVVANVLAMLTPGEDGRLVLDLADPVVRGMTVTHQGDVLWPPPPVQVSVAPAPPAPPAPEVRSAVGHDKAGSRRLARAVTFALAAVLAGLLVAASPPGLTGHFTVLALAVVVGFYVISHVSHSLHTPLMSQTNAVSGIILVGALLQIGSSSWIVTLLAVVAASVASINIFGGFLVTHRMLGMFRRGPVRSATSRGGAR